MAIGQCSRSNADENQVWALDFIFDSTVDGRPIKALSMCEEYTRESIGRRLARSITADDVVQILHQTKAKRGAPEYRRMDNGPEMIAAAIRDWCRLWGTGTHYIEPGSPWEDPFVESFNARSRVLPQRQALRAKIVLSSKQGGRPMPLVVMGAPFDLVRLDRKQRLSAVEGQLPASSTT